MFWTQVVLADGSSSEARCHPSAFLTKLIERRRSPSTFPVPVLRTLPHESTQVVTKDFAKRKELTCIAAAGS